MHRITVLGSGEVPQKALNAILDDLWESVPGDRRLVVTIATDEPSRAESCALEWAVDGGYPFEVFYPKGATPYFLYAEATRQYPVIDPIMDALSSLSVTDHLLLAWDDNDPVCMRAVKQATRDGITACDLTMGLMELEYEEEPDEDGDQVFVTLPIADARADDDDEDLPVTLPMRDDDAKTDLLVLADQMSTVVALLGDILSALTSGPEAPKATRARSTRARKDTAGV